MKLHFLFPLLWWEIISRVLHLTETGGEEAQRLLGAGPGRPRPWAAACAKYPPRSALSTPGAACATHPGAACAKYPRAACAEHPGAASAKYPRATCGKHPPRRALSTPSAACEVPPARRALSTPARRYVVSTHFFCFALVGRQNCFAISTHFCLFRPPRSSQPLRSVDIFRFFSPPSVATAAA